MPVQRVKYLYHPYTAEGLRNVSGSQQQQLVLKYKFCLHAPVLWFGLPESRK